jgi:hypothetical protein
MFVNYFATNLEGRFYVHTGALGHGRVGEMIVVTASGTVFSTNRTGFLHQVASYNTDLS